MSDLVLGDRVAVELLLEDGLDGRLGVEPIEEGRGRFALVQALVEGLAEGGGETGDFCDAGHGCGLSFSWPDCTKGPCIQG